MIVLVLGGARSGKSEAGERLASRAAGSSKLVTYVATAVGDPDDEDLESRIATHRARRPEHWETEELPLGGDLAAALRRIRGVALVDSLGAWLAGFEGFEVDSSQLLGALREREGDTVVVSDEVGLGVHPSSDAGRLFRDRLGLLNRTVASDADDVLLVVAGRVLRLAGFEEAL